MKVASAQWVNATEKLVKKLVILEVSDWNMLCGFQ